MDWWMTFEETKTQSATWFLALEPMLQSLSMHYEPSVYFWYSYIKALRIKFNFTQSSNGLKDYEISIDKDFRCNQGIDQIQFELEFSYGWARLSC